MESRVLAAARRYLGQGLAKPSDILYVLDKANSEGRSTNVVSSRPDIWTVESDSGDVQRFYWKKHVQYIDSLGKKKQNFEYYVTEHLRMSGIYWGLGGKVVRRFFSRLATSTTPLRPSPTKTHTCTGRQVDK